jgi:hypothetical protein
VIRCPKCRFVQDAAPECARCGIVFAKYEARLLQVEEDDDEGDVITDTFAALQPVRGPSPPPLTRPWRERRTWQVSKWVLLLLLVPALVGAVVLSSMTMKLHRTEAYATLTAFLTSHERLAAEIGDGVHLRWWILGRVEADHETGTAVFVVPVSGPEGIGRVGATMVKAYGRWEVASSGFLWPSGREVILSGNGWSDSDRLPPCPRDIAAFRFTAEELLMRGEDFRPGAGGFSEKSPLNRLDGAMEEDEPGTPDHRPLYRKLSAEEVRGLLVSEDVRLGDEPPLWREQKLLTQSQERLWLEGGPLKPTDLVLRRGKAGQTRAAGYLAAAWLNEHEGYAEASVEWIAGKTSLVLYFRADWCPECLEFERYTLRAPRVREALDRMVKVRVNPENSERSRLLADAWRVEGYPALYVLPVDGADPVQVGTHRRDPGGMLSFPSWVALPPDVFLDHLKAAVNAR